MSNLEDRLNKIEEVCAPKEDNQCLHNELSGLSVREMSGVMAVYASDIATKHLPALDMNSFLKGVRESAALAQPETAGDPGMYKFEDKK